MSFERSGSRGEPGAPVETGGIPLSVPNLAGNEWRYVKECLDSGWVSSAGPFVDRFERELAQRVGARHAVATSSGTAALHVALLVAGLAPDEEVIVPALTFVAPANAVRYVGAWPVFVDVEPDHWQLDPAKTAAFLERECRWTNGRLENTRTGRRVRGILPVHLLGHPADMTPILEVARRYDLFVVEDATESLGARYRDVPVGRLGDAACLSFNGNKTITTGGGGMLLTDHADWAERARYLTTQAKDDPVEYVHNAVGYNYRLTSLQAAVGVAQLEELDAFVAIKRRHARAYTEALADVVGLECPREADWAFSTFWLYTVAVDPARFGESRHALMRRLASAGIQSRPLWQPLVLNAAHAGSHAYRVEHAHRIHERALSLPSSTSLTDVQVERVVAALRRS